MSKKKVEPNKIYTDPNNPNKKYKYQKVEVIPSTFAYKLGRIILFIVGLGFVGLAINPIVASISSLLKLGFKGDLESYYYVFNIASGFLSVLLFASMCFITSITGKISFKNIVYAIIMFILVASGTILFFLNKTPITFENVFSLIMTYILPILYLVGFLLMKIRK